MKATPSNRDPTELEREASNIRADMDRTLSALERKFSPGQLLDKSVGYLRDHGGELTRNVGDTVKQNPIPVLLTAAGLTWLIASSMSSRSRSSDLYGESYDELGDTYSGGAESRASGLKGKLSEKLHRGADSVKGTWRSKTQNLRSSRASGRMSDAMDSTRARAHQAQERAHDMLDEQPLVIGALALAAGAIVGAALPTTRYENQTLGPVRDRTLERAREMGEHEYQNLRSKLEPQDEVHVSGRAN